MSAQPCILVASEAVSDMALVIYISHYETGLANQAGLT